MARKVKCPSCETLNDKEDTIEIGKKYYCKECAQAKEELSKANKSDWDELFEYITELYGEKPNGLMYKQLGEFRKDPYNYTNKGMYLTLKYFHEALENPVKQDTGLGIIPYVYDKAKKNFIENMDISNYNQEFEPCENIKQITVKDQFNRARNIKVKLISFDDIDKEIEVDYVK